MKQGYWLVIWVVALAALGLVVLNLLRPKAERSAPRFPRPSPSPRGESTASPVAILVGAGDIASCDEVGDEETARLLDSLPGTVFTLGDNVYNQGSLETFQACYEPNWGRHKARTRPALGNHDYVNHQATDYFTYFGQRAGPRGQGYYSYDLGPWHVVVLNDNCRETSDSCNERSEQLKWLRADLASNPSMCTLAYWHQPTFSSSLRSLNDSHFKPFWQVLYDNGVDVILNGHEHHYERFASQNPDGVTDPERGIRQFVVGTGGRTGQAFGLISSTSEVRDNSTDGVLKLSLYEDGYAWQFIPVAGGLFTDQGNDRCH